MTARTRTKITIAILSFGLSATALNSAYAGPVGSGIGGAIIGGILGDIVGGSSGAAFGAAIGAGVGATRGERRREADRARYRRDAQRSDWNRQRDLEGERMRSRRSDSRASREGRPQVDPVLVSEIQRSLIRLGYDPGPVGRMNQQTTAAIKDYEASKGLLVTGNLSQPLLQHMIRSGG